MPSLVIAWSHVHTFRCPSCGSLATEWHPDTYRERKGWGKCHAAGCGITWQMDGKGRKR